MGGGALSDGDNDICLCLSASCTYSNCDSYGNHQTNDHHMKIWENVAIVKIDYRMQYYDVITNTRWRPAEHAL